MPFGAFGITYFTTGAAMKPGNLEFGLAYAEMGFAVVWIHSQIPEPYFPKQK
jgi:hypothetical protein